MSRAELGLSIGAYTAIGVQINVGKAVDRWLASNAGNVVNVLGLHSQRMMLTSSDVNSMAFSLT